MERSAHDVSRGDQATGDRRIESWKEIARFLNRDVRTVQRWERREGLPVHRHQHDAHATVFAYASELEGWLSSRVNRPDSTTVSDPVRPRPLAVWTSASRGTRLASAAAIVIVLAGAVTGWRALRPREPEIAFAARNWVLVTAFDNRTSEALFDGTYEYALTAALSASRFVNVVPRERIEDVLRLMRKPLDTRLDAVIGRELARRDGNIAAVLTGRIEKVAGRYLLTAQVIRPVDGAIAHTLVGEASSHDEVAAAIDRQAAAVRRSLGEALADVGTREQFARVTTVSLRALQAYSQAETLAQQRQHAAARQLVHEAIELDPEFASAHLLLGRIVLAATGDREQATRLVDHAAGLADRTTDRERDRIIAARHQMRFEWVPASAALEALVRRYPDDADATFSLANMYSALGRLEEAAALMRRATDMRPHDFLTNLRAARLLQSWTNDHASAARYLERARMAATPELIARHGVDSAFFHFFSAYHHWRRGDFDAVSQEIDAALALRPRAVAAGIDITAQNAVTFLASLGRLEEAEDVAQSIGNPAERRFVRSRLRELVGDVSGARRDLLAVPVDFGATAPALARTGLFETARAAAARDRRMFGDRGGDSEQIIAIHASVGRGRLDEALRLLRELVPRMRRPSAVFYLTVESVATRLAGSGQSAPAIALLEDASRVEPWLTTNGLEAAWWYRIQMQLATVYRQVGRAAEAEPIEDRLRRLLARADRDHPIARRLALP